MNLVMNLLIHQTFLNKKNGFFKKFEIFFKKLFISINIKFQKMLQYDKINRILSGIQWSYNYRDFIDFRKKVLAVRSQWRAGSDPIGSRSGERVNN